ncbi:hypothetical protein [Achromobacter sp. UMC46]|uniref:hypothetical protein n=1 Tax=Achromobacter sp. UMC46 TaxID=1862319 RepID=UPI0016033F4A|nr:hypothetical protein [Achromobacter sp. UMC46]MBB1596876.1 hypothetical protein [Achromobacter sp. UMC46]
MAASEIMMFSLFPKSGRSFAVHNAPHALRQIPVLTSANSHRVRSSGSALPPPVLEMVTERHFSALRAWRTHRGLSLSSLQQRTHMLNPTLLALDRGDVELCQWTVELFAKALRVDAALLLATQTLLAQTLAAVTPIRKFPASGSSDS